MPACQITLSANAGVALLLGAVRIWSDALHNHKISGFSTLTPELQSTLQSHPDFFKPDLIFYTHCHPDHYSYSLTARALKQNPQALLALPEPAFEQQVLLTGERCRLSVGPISAEFARLPHEGKEYIHVPHYGCILENSGFRVLIPGDCALAAPQLGDFIGGRNIDLALVDFPWVTLQKGRRFLEQIIQPEHLLVYHLPFPQDDRWGYRRATEKAAPLLSGIPDVRLLLEPFQQEVIP